VSQSEKDIVVIQIKNTSRLTRGYTVKLLQDLLTKLYSYFRTGHLSLNVIQNRDSQMFAYVTIAIVCKL